MYEVYIALVGQIDLSLVHETFRGIKDGVFTSSFQTLPPAIHSTMGFSLLASRWLQLSLAALCFGVYIHSMSNMSNIHTEAAYSTRNWGTFATGEHLEELLPPCSSNKRLQLTIVSDRNTTNGPIRGGGRNKKAFVIKALVNSILKYTTNPVDLYIVTSPNSFELQYLQELDESSPAFNVYPIWVEPLLQHSRHVMNISGFTSYHYSTTFAMVKPFLSVAKDQFCEHTRKVLLLDDDHVFFEDVSPLYQYVLEQPDKVSLYCPIDRRRVDRTLVRQGVPHNGDKIRYCISGMLGIPINNSTSSADRFEQAAINMVKEYPNYTYWFADQDIVNRAFAEQPESTYHLIPCEWSCDCNSCRNQVNQSCKNCKLSPGATCRAYHYLDQTWFQTYKFEHLKQEHQWQYYYNLNSTELLHEEFIPRVAKHAGACQT